MTNGDDQTFHDAIEGYCSGLSYVAGDSVELHTSTRATSYDVVVERWGATRETVFEQTAIPGVFTEPPADADANGCGWPVGVSFTVGGDWRSGFYLVTMTAHDVEADRSVAHTGFVVRASTRGSMLYVLPTNTWQAYNCLLYTSPSPRDS